MQTTRSIGVSMHIYALLREEILKTIGEPNGQKIGAKS
jgi:hypothetical protein